MLFNKYNFALKNFVSKSDIRPEISGIFITPKETIATDGHRMMLVQSVQGFDLKDYPLPLNSHAKKPLANFTPFILPIGQAEKVIKVFPAGKNRTDIGLPIIRNAIIVNNSNNQVEIGRNYASGIESVISQTIAGEYPKYSPLLNNDGKFKEVIVNVRFLKDAVDFFEKFINQNLNQIFLRIPDKADAPIRITGFRDNESGELQKAVAVIMPIKL